MLSRHLKVKHECTLNTIRESAKEKKCVWNGGKRVCGRGGNVCVCVGRCINMHTTYSNKPKLFVSVAGILWFPEVDSDHCPTTPCPLPEIPVKLHTLCLHFLVFEASSSLRNLLSFLWGQYRPCLLFLSPSLKAYQAATKLLLFLF